LFLIQLHRDKILGSKKFLFKDKICKHCQYKNVSICHCEFTMGFVAMLDLLESVLQVSKCVTPRKRILMAGLSSYLSGVTGMDSA